MDFLNISYQNGKVEIISTDQQIAWRKGWLFVVKLKTRKEICSWSCEYGNTIKYNKSENEDLNGKFEEAWTGNKSNMILLLANSFTQTKSNF